MKKLTLSADEEVIELAKKIATMHKTSISALFEHLVRFLSKREGALPPLGPIARSASGIIKLPPRRREKEILEDALMEKEGL